MTTTNPNTTSVVWIVSLRVGHETLPRLQPGFLTEREKLPPGAVNHATTTAAPISPPSTISTAQHDCQIAEVVIAPHSGDHQRDRQCRS